MRMGAIIFVVLAIIAWIVATGLSWGPPPIRTPQLYLLSAVLFLIAGLFFLMAKRTASSPH